VKESKIRRLIPKKLAREAAAARGARRARLQDLVEQESAETMARMRAKGYRLVTRLETGEGVFVRDDPVVALHVQLPRELYRRLEAECRRRESSKKKLVCEALTRYLDATESRS